MAITLSWFAQQRGRTGAWRLFRATALLCAALAVASEASAQVPAGALAGRLPTLQPTPGALPLSLSDAIDRGLKWNLSLIALEEQVESARGARLRSLRELMPRVDARANESRQTTNLAAFGFDSSVFPGVPAIVGPYNIFDARAYGSQSVYDRSARRDLASKTSSLNAARLDEENARDLVTLAVTNLYFQAIAGQSRIESTRSQVATAEALFNQATNLRNAGAAPGIDVVRSQVQVQAQRQRLIAAENDLAKQTVQLARTIGLATGQQIELTDRAMTLPGVPGTVDDALKRATTGRADYKASIERVHAAEAALDSTRAGAFPSVHVNGDYGAIGSNPADARRTYSMSANVRVSLFDQDRVGHQVENTAALRQRVVEAKDLEQRIEADVRTAFLDVQATEQQLAVARERVALVNQELSLARIRFTAGVTNNLEVVQAQNEVAAAADNEVAASYAFNVAKAALTRAIGGAGVTHD